MGELGEEAHFRHKIGGRIPVDLAHDQLPDCDNLVPINGHVDGTHGSLPNLFLKFKLLEANVPPLVPVSELIARNLDVLHLLLVVGGVKSADPIVVLFVEVDVKCFEGAAEVGVLNLVVKKADEHHGGRQDHAVEHPCVVPG
jgi:hypothetical protein